jgi:hypothetical protein
MKGRKFVAALERKFKECKEQLGVSMSAKDSPFNSKYGRNAQHKCEDARLGRDDKSSKADDAICSSALGVLRGT